MGNIVIQALAVLSAPLLYGILCLPLAGIFLAQFPERLNALGGTHDPKLVVGIEALQLLTLLLCGAAVELIAGRSDSSYRTLLTATATMLAIGIAVQYRYWSTMPTWNHIVFFMLILVGMPAGAVWLRRRRRRRRPTGPQT